MELIDNGKQPGQLTQATNADRDKLAILIKEINDCNDFTAGSFITAGAGKTLAPNGATNTNYRIDSQTPSADSSFANIQYQVGKDSKGACYIYYTYYTTDAKIPIPEKYPTTVLRNDKASWTDGQIKAMVQDGLAVGAKKDPNGMRSTSLRWRIIPIGSRKKDDVKMKLRDQYGKDILTRGFEEIGKRASQIKIVY